MLRRHVIFEKTKLVFLILVAGTFGYFVYLQAFASSGTVSSAGCDTLQQESQWQAKGNKCVGPQGVELYISR